VYKQGTDQQKMDFIEARLAKVRRLLREETLHRKELEAELKELNDKAYSVLDDIPIRKHLINLYKALKNLPEKHYSFEIPPTSECVLSPFSSRVCDYGVKCCDVIHKEKDNE